MTRSTTLPVIDFHVHIGLKEHWHEWVHRFQKEADSEFYTRYQDMTDPETFARYVVGQGISRAVILPEISPITTGIVSNEYVLNFTRGREVYIPFGTVNPSLATHPHLELKRLIREGVRGVKLYPSYNRFFPDDSRLYPLYEVARDEGIPVLIHTGSSVFEGALVKYANPLHLDEVARRFPGLILVMAHSGRGLWYREAAFLARLHEHLYCEISGLPPKKLLEYFPDLERNADKFLFGSDWPGIQSIASNIQDIKSLPIRTESIEKILYRNAARILGLPEAVGGSTG
ncbi:MAG: amidohydrolase family protein [Candidatus Aminicenantales bacterium]